MTAVRLYFDADRVGPLFQRSVSLQADRVRAVMRATAKQVVDDVKQEAAVDMASAGKFGSRWTGGLRAKISEGGGNIRIAFSHDVPYFSVFQFGATIHGKPLLWIPLSFAEDAKGVYARDYSKPLFRVDRKDPAKAPLLLTPGKPAQPKYFGKTEVTIPKKFHVIEIIHTAAKTMAVSYHHLLTEVDDG